MGCGAGIFNGRRALLVGLIVSALAPLAVTHQVVSQGTRVPNPAESLSNTLNNSDLDLQVNFLQRRQNSCPNPSTEQFCDSNSCFLVQNNADGSWGTCCPAGWSLILYGGGENQWSTQKCCPPGSSVEQCKDEDISIPPLQPLGCGTGGILSGWGCVYGSGFASGSNTGYKPQQSLVLVAVTGIIWFVRWN